ncbi:MAG: transketolase family protein, partial [Bacteroidales bacterium]|jgi:transketolase|nr:transketolase family protein [Bacteroidales bacterium]
VYLRCGRPEVPNFTPADRKFEIGKGEVLQQGSDVTIIAIGHLVYPALEAADILAEKGISAEVVKISTLKPLDSECILNSVRKTGKVITCEEHQIAGGLGESVASLLMRLMRPYAAVPMDMLGVEDKFGQSGKPQELMDFYGLNTAGIVDRTQRLCRERL